MRGSRRVVIAGQIPPPWGGQNVMVQQALTALEKAEDLDVIHLPFNFTRDWEEHRRAGLGKAWELLSVLVRLVRIRLTGRIDCLLYPFGGPHFAPLMRDTVLLPFCLAVSRRVFLHIHAGGIADALPHLPKLPSQAALWLYRRCSGAIVLTEFSRVDAESLGIHEIFVVSNTLPDTYDPALVTRSPSEPIRLLYVGHLGAPKGTPSLLQATAGLRDLGHDVRLTLIGEPLPPYSRKALSELILALDLTEKVDVAGVTIGPNKWRAFGSADLFVFPSVAPESQPLVLLEAMMWRLPIVATNWRAHSEILGSQPDGICYKPGRDRAGSLQRALEEAIAMLSDFKTWGDHNRRRFESHYDEKSPLLLSFLEQRCTAPPKA